MVSQGIPIKKKYLYYPEPGLLKITNIFVVSIWNKGIFNYPVFQPFIVKIYFLLRILVFGDFLFYTEYIKSHI